MGDTKKAHIVCLEIKATISEMKNTLDGIHRLHTAEENITKCENRTIETPQRNKH